MPIAEMPVPAAPPAPAKVTGRVMSLDALRGFDMFWIIGLAGVFRALGQWTKQQWLTEQMEHPLWYGLHVYDFIFPTFIFIVGASLVFSLDKTIQQHGRREAIKRICRRSALLFFLGFLHSGGMSKAWPDTQFVGVLNRIALAYFFTGLIFCFCDWRGLLAFSVGILVCYDVAVAYLPMRDIHLDKETFAKLEKETGKSDAKEIFLATTNWTHGKFDFGYNLVNQVDFLYLPGFKAYTYFTSDGILSTAPAIVTCLLGVFAGLLLKSGNFCDKWKLIYLFSIGTAGVLAGLIWSLHFPIVKKLWSPSYLLLAAGCSSILLGIFYWLIDVKKWQRWCQPFIWVGMNSITIYLSLALVDWKALGGRFAGGSVAKFFNGIAGKGCGEFIVACVGLTLAVWLCRFLYERKIFLRL